MKTTLLIASAAMLAVGSLFAGPGQFEIIKQRARDTQNQLGAPAGTVPPVQPAPPAQPVQPVQPAPPKPAQLTPEQLSLNRFQAGLAAIKMDEPVVDEKKQQLAKDLQGAVQGSNKPPLEAVNKLVSDLCAAFAQRPLDAGNCALFVKGLDAVLNPAKYPQAKPDLAMDDVQALLQTTGLTRRDALKVVEEVKALSNSK